jgi:hypothetical protein
MARILNIYSKPESASGPRLEAAPPLVLPDPKIDTPDDDVSDVPFIEIGSPAGRVMSKGLQDLAPAPTIIPMPRPAVRSVIEPKPELAPMAAVPYFRISFQSLPFHRERLSPAERRFGQDLVAYHAPEHLVGEQYRQLAREVENQLASEPKKTLLFSSAAAGAGTTSVVLNLSITLARGEQTRVVVVDANFDRPAVADRFGLPSAPGIREILGRTIPLAWGFQETGVPNLSALTSGNRFGEPSLDIWPLLLDQLRQRFDWVLIDAAEWADRPDLTALTATAAATFLVLRPADLEMPGLDGLFADIPRHGGRLRGYVVAQR